MTAHQTQSHLESFSVPADSSGKEYKNYKKAESAPTSDPQSDPTDDRFPFVVDFPFHGNGRKSIRHKFYLEDEDATLEVSIGIHDVWAAAGAHVDVAVDFGMPNGHVRINPGRPDLADTVIDGQKTAKERGMNDDTASTDSEA